MLFFPSCVVGGLASGVTCPRRRLLLGLGVSTPTCSSLCGEVYFQSERLPGALDPFLGSFEASSPVKFACRRVFGAELFYPSLFFPSADLWCLLFVCDSSWARDRDTPGASCHSLHCRFFFYFHFHLFEVRCWDFRFSSFPLRLSVGQPVLSYTGAVLGVEIVCECGPIPFVILPFFPVSS